MKDLKGKAVRGGAVRIANVGANFAIRLCTLMVLARLLNPADFGLVGMVTAFTGLLSMFRDFGLSAVAVQRAHITDEQASGLFWINILAGVGLALVTVGAAPAIADFYHDHRLIGVTIAMAAALLFNAAAVQHGARLQREMRFTAITVVQIVALVLSAAIAIGGALAGFGYWALVEMAVISPLVVAIGFWLTTSWIPGPPRRVAEIRSMLRFGGALTLNGVIVYIANNAEKVLLGRYWGPVALGIYGKAYQLSNMGTSELNFAAGEVAFSGLSRLQNDPPRLRSYFLKGYSIVLSLTLPATIGFALFANDLILVVLGPKWVAAVPILRLLVPTVLVFAVANPLSWLLTALGRVGRLLKMCLVSAPLTIACYFVGLPYGPKGVALARSVELMLWLIPLVIWALHGTPVSPKDIVRTVKGPLLSAIVAGGAAFAVRWGYGQMLPPVARLALECSILLSTYSAMLLFVAGQKSLYLDLLHSFIGRSSVKEDSLVSA